MKAKREKILEDPEAYRQEQINRRVPDDFEDLPDEMREQILAELEDVVASIDLPEEIKVDPYLQSACVAGALRIDEVEALLAEAGFGDICILPKDESREFIKDWAPGRGVEDYVMSASIEAVKP